MERSTLPLPSSWATSATAAWMAFSSPIGMTMSTPRARARRGSGRPCRRSELARRTPTVPHGSRAFPPLITTSPLPSERRSSSSWTSTGSPRRRTISRAREIWAFTFQRSSTNPAAKRLRSTGFPVSSSATNAFVVPRVMTTVPEERASLTTGREATPFAIRRLEALGFKTTQAFIFLPVCSETSRYAINSHATIQNGTG